MSESTRSQRRSRRRGVVNDVVAKYRFFFRQDLRGPKIVALRSNKTETLVLKTKKYGIARLRSLNRASKNGQQRQQRQQQTFQSS